MESCTNSDDVGGDVSVDEISVANSFIVVIKLATNIKIIAEV